MVCRVGSLYLAAPNASRVFLHIAHLLHGSRHRRSPDASHETFVACPYVGMDEACTRRRDTRNGCDLGEPDRYINTAARPPSIDTLTFNDLRPGQHIGGPLTLDISQDEGTRWARHAVLLVDGRRVREASGFPLAIILYTDEFDEGTHDVAVALARSPEGIEANAGLLNLGEIGGSAVLLRLPLVFDQTPPTPVPIDSVRWVDGRAHIYWHRELGVNENARTYSVSRTMPLEGLAGTVPGPDSTFLIDAGEPIPRIVGLEAGYRLDVWNGRIEGNNQVRVVASSPVYAAHRTPLVDGLPPLTLGHQYEAVQQPSSDRVYLLDNGSATEGDSLYAVSLGTQAAVKRRALRTAFEPNGYGVTLTPDGEALVVVERSYELPPRLRAVVYDPVTLEEVRATDLAFSGDDLPPWLGGAVVADAAGYVYFVQRSQSRIYGYDTETGAEVLNMDVGTEVGGYVTGLVIGPQGRFLTGWYYGGSLASPAHVFRVDLEASPAAVVATRVFGGAREIHSFRAGPGDGALYAAFSEESVVEVLDPTSLETVQTISVSGSDGDFPVLMQVDEASIYMRVFSEGLGPLSKGRLVRYDRVSGARIGHWPYRNTVRYLSAPAGTGTMLVVTQGEYVVDEGNGNVPTPRTYALPVDWMVE